jgi:hypothetical protein
MPGECGADNRVTRLAVSQLSGNRLKRGEDDEFQLKYYEDLLDKFCGLLKKLKNNGNNNSSGGNGNSGGSGTISITVNINIGKGNNISNLHFITTDELSKIKTFDATIKKSVMITTDDISLWMYCNTGNRHECFALGIYLISSYILLYPLISSYILLYPQSTITIKWLYGSACIQAIILKLSRKLNLF